MSQTKSHPQSDAKAKPRKQALTPMEEGDPEEGGNRFLLFNVMPSWMVSFLTHLAVIVVLAIIVMPNRQPPDVAIEASEQTAESMDSFDLNLDALEMEAEDPLANEISAEDITDVSQSLEATLPEPEVNFDSILAAEAPLIDGSIGELSMSDLHEETGSRLGDNKKKLLDAFGGTPGSEEAVALALKWIIKHQLPDGGWNLDHTRGPGDFRNSPNPGQYTDARSAATALALLPLLGSGHTHERGDYTKEVGYALEYLKSRGQRSGRGRSYLEPGGTMYSHGLVAIVFCEAYAMTKDPDLLPYAQETVWFIEDAQDPIGGGWRYQPREPGDTSAVGWQMMALKSAKITGLNVKPRTYKRAEKFLDSVSSSGGAFYGYMRPPNGPNADARTAIGLLCRMYMGWGKSVPGLVDGVEALSLAGPHADESSADMYYNYYATQVMKHMGGSKWNQWNRVMRDFLIATQSKEGDAAGSWHFGRGHAPDAGGRLYTTALACMTLEVYYRYLPLYGDQAANEEFPLE